MAAPKTVITISITKTLQSEVTPENGGNRLQVAVTDSENIDPRIFVYQIDVDSEFSPEDLALFYSVASVPQMSSLPADAGGPDEPFFRLNTLDLVFETPDELEDALASIVSEIKSLQRGNDVLLDPENEEVICMEITEGVATVVECPE